MRYHHLSVDPPPRTPPGAVLLYHGPVRVTRAGAAARTQICPEIPCPPLDKENGVCYIAHIAMKRTSSGAAAAQRTPGR